MKAQAVTVNGVEIYATGTILGKALETLVRWITPIVCLRCVIGGAMLGSSQLAQARTGGAYDRAGSKPLCSVFAAGAQVTGVRSPAIRWLIAGQTGR